MLKLYLNIYISHDIYGPDFEFDPPTPLLNQLIFGMPLIFIEHSLAGRIELTSSIPV